MTFVFSSDNLTIWLTWRMTKLNSSMSQLLKTFERAANLSQVLCACLSLMQIHEIHERKLCKLLYKIHDDWITHFMTHYISQHKHIFTIISHHMKENQTSKSQTIEIEMIMLIENLLQNLLQLKTFSLNLMLLVD